MISSWEAFDIFKFSRGLNFMREESLNYIELGSLESLLSSLEVY